MALSPSPRTCSLFLFLFSVSGLTAALAQVPANETFTEVNDGEFGDYITEYGDSYRTTGIFAAPFQVMWHNSTPGQYYLGIRWGLSHQEPLFRWVWDANRGRPVGEKATLSFGADGDLVLKEADGRVVWSTNTANKGVVGLRLLPVGNLVLYDKRGRFVWQSFDYPTDTLLVGQSLRRPGAGPTKIVSRKSETENSAGRYSLVLGRRALRLYVDAAPKRFPYGEVDTFIAVTNLTFTAVDEENGAWELGLQMADFGTRILARPKHNATISMLRLQADGNLVIYTYDEKVDSEPTDRTFVYFNADGDTRGVPGCELPSKCGSLGVCKDDMCVACPTPGGLLGWSEECSPPKLPGPCKPGAGYYKVAGVENFLTKFTKGEGAVKVEECRRRCSSDCKCLGFFFWEESSSCWLAPALGTLNRVSNSSHVAYIKSNSSNVAYIK